MILNMIFDDEAKSLGPVQGREIWRDKAVGIGGGSSSEMLLGSGLGEKSIKTPDNLLSNELKPGY